MHETLLQFNTKTYKMNISVFETYSKLELFLQFSHCLFVYCDTKKQLDPETKHFMFNKNTMSFQQLRGYLTEATTRSGETFKNKYCSNSWSHDNIT